MLNFIEVLGGKLQITPLKFGGDWILYHEVVSNPSTPKF